jgi:hypothetical protein
MTVENLLADVWTTMHAYIPPSLATLMLQLPTHPPAPDVLDTLSGGMHIGQVNMFFFITLDEGCMDCNGRMDYSGWDHLRFQADQAHEAEKARKPAEAEDKPELQPRYVTQASEEVAHGKKARRSTKHRSTHERHKPENMHEPELQPRSATQAHEAVVHNKGARHSTKHRSVHEQHETPTPTCSHFYFSFYLYFAI